MLFPSSHSNLTRAAYYCIYERSSSLGGLGNIPCQDCGLDRVGFGGAAARPLRLAPVEPAARAVAEVKADLPVTGAAVPDPIQVLRTLTYAWTVTNKGPAAAGDVVPIDKLPTELTFSSAAARQGTCRFGGTLRARTEIMSQIRKDRVVPLR